MQTRIRNNDGPALKVVLISTYELGRQPFGLASPAAWLRRAGMEVATADLSVGDLPEAAVIAADLVAFYIPMYTATRLAMPVVERVKAANPHTHICFYGLYASVNEIYLRNLGAQTILGGEFEAGLLHLADSLQESRIIHERQTGPVVSLERQDFLIPDRSDLPPLSRYARLKDVDNSEKQVGYVEASRGCKHLCRHCPVVPVYAGKFRIVQSEIVLEDIRRQVSAGAEHITFGDPDFFNGIGHALPLVEALQREFPDLTYDATIKVEHLLKHAKHLSILQETGCKIITTAVESLDDTVLFKLNKGHTRADFIQALQICREHLITLNPTFIPFSPWTTAEGYADLLETLSDLELIEEVAPIQLAIRLLIPEGSLLLELADIQEVIAPFRPESLNYPWKHAEPRVDQLQEVISGIIKRGLSEKASRKEIFGAVWEEANTLTDRAPPVYDPAPQPSLATIPYLTEPWYC